MMTYNKWNEKEEEIEDRGDASQKNRRRWRLNGYREDDTPIWRKVLVDKYNQPLYDVDGKYIPRTTRQRIKNEREKYFRNNPHKSHWKTNLNKRERNRIKKSNYRR